MREVFVLESLLKEYPLVGGSIYTRRKALLFLAILSDVMLSEIIHGDPEEEEKRVSVSYQRLQRAIHGVLSISTITRWLTDPAMRQYLEKVERGYCIWDKRVKLPVFRIMKEAPIYNPVVVGIDLDAIQLDGVIYEGKRYPSVRHLTDLYFRGKKKSMSEYWQKYRELREKCKPTNFVKEITTRKYDIKEYYAADVARNGKKIELEHNVSLSKDGIREAVKERKNLRVLDTMSDESGNMTFKYYRSNYGRYYLSGNPLQFTPSVLREKVLSNYFELDMSCASFIVLRECGRRLGISTDDYPEFSRLLKDPKGYRRKKYESFKRDAETLTEGYIKTVLNAIAYGAVLNTKRTLMDAIYGTKVSFLIRTEGYSNLSIPLNVSCDEDLVRLQKEIRHYARRIMKACRDDVFLINAAGLRMYWKGSSFGQKIAHLYQGLESEILKEIMQFPLPDGTPLCKVDGSIGLLLHDGIYINKTFWDMVEPESVSSYLLKKGYQINFTRK